MPNYAIIILSVAIICLTGSLIYVGYSIKRYCYHSTQPPLTTQSQTEDVSDAIRSQVVAVWVASYNHSIIQHEKLTSFLRVTALAGIVLWTSLASQKAIQMDTPSIVAISFFAVGLAFLIGPLEVLAYGPRDIAVQVAKDFNNKSNAMEKLPEKIISANYFWNVLIILLCLIPGFWITIKSIIPSA